MASTARALLPHLAPQAPPTGLVLVPDARGDALDELAASDIAPDLLRDVVLPQRLLTSADCLDLYREMFRDRVEQLLALRMPAVHEALGALGFRELVHEFLAAHPAGSADLSRIGDEFTRFLAGARELAATHRSWVAELARFECAIVRCATAHPADELDVADVAEFSPLEWEFARFEPAPGLELLAFDHAIDDVYSSWLHGGGLDAPRPGPQYVAVLRQGTQVQRAPMTRRAWNLLHALCSGAPLLPAIVEELDPADRASVERRVRTWLHAWITNGFFRAVHAS